MATLQQYEAQINAFSSQLSLLEQVAQEHARAQTTIEGLRSAKTGQELLIPIGQGTFIFGKLTNTDKAMISIGSDITQEVKMDEALQRVGDRLKETEEAMEGYMRSLDQMKNQYAALKEQAELAIQEARAQGAIPHKH